ncbi:MAG: hypothetical protein MUO26_11535 [Methanotrichaceae archaeon]|nr:hypothetical protein [Methanotrichaceae archaeon]
MPSKKSPQNPKKEKSVDTSGIDIESLQKEVLQEVEGLQEAFVGTVEDGKFVYFGKNGITSGARLTTRPISGFLSQRGFDSRAYVGFQDRDEEKDRLLREKMEKGSFN